MFFKVTELVFGAQMVKVTLDCTPRTTEDKAENYNVLFDVQTGYQSSVRQQPLKRGVNGVCTSKLFIAI